MAAPALSPNAEIVLAARYLLKNEQGQVIETPEALFRRVSFAVAAAERGYMRADAFSDFADPTPTVARAFQRMLTNLEFLPNSPTLANAGKPGMALSACYVLPVGDSLEEIFETVKSAALIWQAGGGTGFAFSRLRPEGSIVRSTGGVASGPVSFMKVFDGATEAIKQGGMRRGANMGILRVDHPDIMKFITVKADMVTLQNFNISVAITDAFMAALAGGEAYDLVDPHTGHVARRMSARAVWDAIVCNAQKNGDPGLFFIDRANDGKANPVSRLGPCESTNPCGEQVLYEYDSCNLGSIDLSRFVAAGGGIDWARLREVVRLAVRFLDNVIDVNYYPLPQIADVNHKIRRIGLGVMGWADMLFKLDIPYGSPASLALAEEVMGFIQHEADEASALLAHERGVFPLWAESIYGEGVDAPYGPLPLRNSARTTVAPTGTLSIIANCSGGIEPVFSLVFIRQHRLDPANPDVVSHLLDVNPVFAAVARREGFYSDDLIQFLAEGGRLADRPEVPDHVKEVFVTTHDVTPEQHVAMQAAFQKYVDNSVSKTVNLPHDATAADVDRIYRLAYASGCKGITIYRDGSREKQVLTHETKAQTAGVADLAAPEPKPVDARACPECDGPMVKTGGRCWECHPCSISLCA